MTDFKKDDDVRVTEGADEYFCKRFKGKEGKVSNFYLDLVTVRFPDGSNGAFFLKELELVK